ncbi:hydroxyacid dehydrogenase [Paracoccus sp. R12_1]|nr:hydroxyacid dehydrogenase [Paracoccus sp. R12_2]MBO9487610.1 hydroxyacid dehydrogenase [Paracoccus sp. R12_1]
MVSQGKITEEVIAASDQLKFIAKHGSGVNNINLHAAEARGIPVFRAVGANARAVAEHAITLMLALRKSLPHLDHATKVGRWLKGSFIGRDILGTRLGLIGMGVIGHEAAAMARALGMHVTAFDPALRPEDVAGDEIEPCSSVGALIANSDIISLHCPLVPSTRHMVDAAFLSKMQSHAVLVNTARGGIIDEVALEAALRQREIAGAAVDSFEAEPPQSDHPLFSAPNLIVTPHAASLDCCRYAAKAIELVQFAACKGKYFWNRVPATDVICMRSFGEIPAAFFLARFRLRLPVISLSIVEEQVTSLYPMKRSAISGIPSQTASF